MVLDSLGKLKNEISAHIGASQILLRMISIESKILIATDCGVVKFIDYDKELRSDRQLTIKGLTNLQVLNERVLIIETHSAI